MDWQIYTDYFKIDINCEAQNIDWTRKELTILEQHEFIQIILTHYDINDEIALHFIVSDGLSMTEIKSQWLENCNVLFRDFKIDVDYFIAPMYIYKNIIQLGVFIYNDKLADMLANMLANKFKIVIRYYLFMSQIQYIDSSINKLATRMAKYLKMKKERFANEDITVSSYGGTQNKEQIKEQWKNINIFNGIIDYSKRMMTFWKENYFVSSSKKKILWQHIFYNIRNYLPKLKCKIISQN